MNRSARSNANSKTQVVFLGAGNMAEALISSMLKGGVLSKDEITAVDIMPERCSALAARFGVKTSPDAAAAVAQGTIIFLAVKPQHMEELLTQVRGSFRKSQLVVSIAAGITTSCIERFLPEGTPVVRTMPNTAALVGAGAIAAARGKNAHAADIELVKKFLSGAGSVTELDEKLLNAVTALSGSGPAYVFLLVELLEEAGTRMGLSAEDAAALARQTVYGAGMMLARLADPARELRRKVTSPGGTTEAAVKHLDENQFSEIFIRAVLQAHKRAGELAR